jgi:hypothetical protein
MKVFTRSLFSMAADAFGGMGLSMAGAVQANAAALNARMKQDRALREAKRKVMHGREEDS